MRTCLVLAGTWLLLSGHYTLERPLIAIFGGLSCAFVCLLAWRMKAASLFESESTVGLRTVLYLPWLLGQIVKANLIVARIVIDPKLPIHPRLVRIKASQRGDGAQVLYANSISLTPGTLSLEVSPDRGTLFVHAMSVSSPDALRREIKDGFERRVIGAFP